MKYDKDNNCREGNCVVLSNIKFKTVERNLQFVKCDTSDEGIDSQK